MPAERAFLKIISSICNERKKMRLRLRIYLLISQELDAPAALPFDKYGV